ncbi:metalloprotease TldD [soil metagenome]
MFQSPAQELERMFGISTGQLEQVFAIALGKSRSNAYCDIYFQTGSTESVVFDEGIIKNCSKELVRGVGVRVVIGDRVGYSFADNVNFTSLKNAAKIAHAICAYSKGATAVSADLVSTHSPLNLYPVARSAIKVPRPEKIALLSKANAEARGHDQRIINVTASIVVQDETVIIANSLGHLVADQRPLVRFNVTCLAEDGKRRESASSGGGGRFDFNTLVEGTNEHAIKAATEAISLLTAVEAPAGEMTVVLGSGWPGVLIHEAIGHGLEGDANRKGTSAFAHLMGEMVASPLCTIVDDGTIPGRRGSLNFDDEGTPTRRTVLIENGVLVGYMQDWLNARLMKVARTGNGRRESYRYAPMPRMTNTYMENGQSTPEEIIASVKYGLYATNFGGGQVDTTSGNFSFSANGAYIIRDGEIAEQVKGATLIGNGPEALRKVTMVGNDGALDSGVGSCGKAGQWVPVGVGMPTIRIENVTVGGTN